MKRFFLTAAMTLALFANASIAGAGEYRYENGCKYEKVVSYVTKIVYVTKSEAYTKYVTYYDHCGKPYQVAKTCYRDVQVPVKKVCPVVKWVKVCY